MTPIPLLGSRIHKATDGKIDWSLTAWEVSRLAQLRRSRGLTLREGSARC